MSGPKIVRIVTREELQAQCRSQLRLVDTALARVERASTRAELWNRELSSALRARREALQHLFDGERWLDLQREAPLEVDFLRDEENRIAAEVIEKAAKAHQRRRRLADAARSIVTALQGMGREVPSAVRRIADAVTTATDAELSGIEADLNAAMRLLASQSTDSAESSQHHELASRLRRGEKDLSYADWVARAGSSDPEKEQRLDRLIAEIETLNDEGAAAFVERANSIRRERSNDRRALLTDSLVLDLGARVSANRAWHALLTKLEDARATLQAYETEAAAELLRRLEATIAKRSVEEANNVLIAAHDLAETEVRREAGRVRRLAVLRGLASLGYEVRENMATALAQSGRIVVRKPGVSDYGVELGAVADAQRVQIQLVGAENPVESRSAARDRDAETQWCSELEKMRATMARTGSTLAVENAIPAGAQRVKTVAFEHEEQGATSKASQPMRKLER